MKMRDELKKALADEVATKKPNVLTLAVSMKAFWASKYGQPSLFIDACIFGEGCIPGVEASFLETNNARPLVYQIFSRAVGDVLEVPEVPKELFISQSALIHSNSRHDIIRALFSLSSIL
jgi:hypothetical protein